MACQTKRHHDTINSINEAKQQILENFYHNIPIKTALVQHQVVIVTGHQTMILHPLICQTLRKKTNHPLGWIIFGNREEVMTLIADKTELDEMSVVQLQGLHWETNSTIEE
jgi:hypothetical protein